MLPRKIKKFHIYLYRRKLIHSDGIQQQHRVLQVHAGADAFCWLQSQGKNKTAKGKALSFSLTHTEV